jgi:hypothetical protein
MESTPAPRPTFVDMLKRRIPARNEVVLVFSIAAFCLFSWELRNYFYQFPAFMLSYRLDNLLSIATYALSFALFETMLTMAVMLLLAFILPGFALRDGFGYKGSFFILACAVTSIRLQLLMSNQPKPQFLLMELARLLTMWLVPVLLIQFIPAVRKIVLDILDRMTIFNYVYIPLGGISLLIVVIRNLW